MQDCDWSKIGHTLFGQCISYLLPVILFCKVKVKVSLDVFTTFNATHLQSLPLRLDLMPILSAKVFLVDLVLAVAAVLAVLLVAAVWWRNIRLFPNLPDLLF